MLMMTSERCPECDSIVYMMLHPKRNNDGEIIVFGMGTQNTPHGHADGCYLDKDGVLCIVRFDENTTEPDYRCIFCSWSS